MTINGIPQNCSPDMGRILLDGVQEIIGRAGVYATFNTAHLTHLLPGDAPARLAPEFTHEELSSLLLALTTLYGPRGGHGVAQRSGRASFKYLLRQFGDAMGLTALEYRLRPSAGRIKTGLEALSQILSSSCGGSVELVDEPKTWIWKYSDCPWCCRQSDPAPSCHFGVGLLQEFLSWASGGRMYHVAETECIAAGAQACTIRIDKQPFD